MPKNAPTRGFTLIEVLIALVIVAVALLALTRAAALQVQTFDALRERTLAGWIAANVLTETRLASGLPATGRRDGQVRYANRNWRWLLDIKATPDAHIRRLDVSVFLEQDNDPSAALSGFAGEDLQP
ncbi:MAG: type II secretion system minor pseudopilin GspI [Dokdonella sp.]